MANKIFISHSSAQKSFVDEMAKWLKRDSLIVDMYCFESGQQLTSVIKKSIDSCALFVVLFSKEALMSPWIEDELNYVRKRVKEKTVRFRPFIIDENVKWNDSEIPDWVSQYITDEIKKPFIVANIIKRNWRELIYDNNEELQQREDLFEGRGSDMQNLTTEYNAHDGVRAIILSGLPHIGRKKFAQRFISNEFHNDSRRYYEPPMIYLDEYDSIDAFALNLNDLLREHSYDEIENIVAKGESEVVKLCVNLLNKMCEYKHRILILDNRSIVKYDGEMKHWLLKIVNNSELVPATHIIIITPINPKPLAISKESHIISYPLSSLDRNSMFTLLKKYARIKGLSMPKQDMDFFVGKLSGYPLQAYNVVDAIVKQDIDYAKQEIESIQKIYDSDFVKSLKLLTYYEESLDLLNFLSNLESISIDTLKRIYPYDHFKEVINDMRRFGLLEFFGTCGEYFRLSPIVADYVNRQKLPLSENYKNAMYKEVKEINNLDVSIVNLSDYLFQVKQDIQKHPDAISPKKIMPSITLKIMVEEYNKGNYESVIKLAEKILNNPLTSSYSDILRDYHYWYCLALARIQNQKFFKVVEYFEYKSYSSFFLRGFYCRHQNNLEQAQKYYEKALEMKTRRGARSKAEHEMVIVYMMQGNYDQALDLACKNYRSAPNNPYHIEAYFRCLVKSKNPDTDDLVNMIEDMGDTLDAYKNVKSETMLAEYDYYINHDFTKAIEQLKQICTQRLDSHHVRYAIEALNEICKRQDCMEMARSIMKGCGYL